LRPHAQDLGRGGHLLIGQRLAGVRRIHQNGDARDRGSRFLQQLESLPDNLGGEHRRARDVPSGPSQAADEPAADGIADVDHDDWNRSRRLLGRERCWGTLRNENVDVEANQLCGKVGDSLSLSRRGSAFNDEVVALGISQLAQSLAEFREVRWLSAPHIPEKADPVYFSGLLLRLRRERRKDEAQSEHGREPDPHKHLGWGRLPGSLAEGLRLRNQRAEQ